MRGCCWPFSEQAHAPPQDARFAPWVPASGDRQNVACQSQHAVESPTRLLHRRLAPDAGQRGAHHLSCQHRRQQLHRIAPRKRLREGRAESGQSACVQGRCALLCLNLRCGRDRVCKL